MRALDDMHLGDGVMVLVYRLLIHARPLSFRPLHYLIFFVCLLFNTISSMSLNFVIPIKLILNFFLPILLLRIWLRGCLCSTKRISMIFMSGRHPLIHKSQVCLALALAYALRNLSQPHVRRKHRNPERIQT